MSTRKKYLRNYGFWHSSEQERLSDSTVAIAGVGGDGYQLGYKLAMMGVGELRVADPEVFELENSNRVLGAVQEHIGVNKAEAFSRDVERLGHGTNVQIFKDGVTTETVDEFLTGADLVIDETELRYLHIGALISRQALEKSIPTLMVMNVGYAGVATSFKPDPRAKGFHEMMGVPRGMPLDEVAELTLDYSRAVPYIPAQYAHMDTFRSVIEGAPLPSISPGVDIASGMGSTEAFAHLTATIKNHRRAPTWFPQIRYMDAYTNKSGIIRRPRFAFASGVLKMYARTSLGLNPEASYTARDLNTLMKQINDKS